MVDKENEATAAMAATASLGFPFSAMYINTIYWY